VSVLLDRGAISAWIACSALVECGAISIGSLVVVAGLIGNSGLLSIGIDWKIISSFAASCITAIDDVLDTQKTAADGTFTLTGSDDEIGSIDPYFKIYHKCDTPITQLCDSKIKVNVPNKYINAHKPFDFGELNLEGKIGEVETDCFH